MILINLLDWRAQRNIILNRRFAFVTSAAVLVALLLAFFVYLVIHNQVNTAKEDVVYLDEQLKSVSGILTQIKELEAQKETLLSKRKTIEILQAKRPLVVKIFDNIARSVPDGIVLTGMSRKADQITLTGTGDSNYSISVLMENIQRLSWVKSAKLGELKTNTVNNAGTALGAKGAITSGAHQQSNISFTLNINLDAEKSGVQNAPT